MGKKKDQREYRKMHQIFDSIPSTKELENILVDTAPDIAWSTSDKDKVLPLTGLTPELGSVCCKNFAMLQKRGNNMTHQESKTTLFGINWYKPTFLSLFSQA